MSFQTSTLLILVNRGESQVLAPWACCSHKHCPKSTDIHGRIEFDLDVVPVPAVCSPIFHNLPTSKTQSMRPSKMKLDMCRLALKGK